VPSTGDENVRLNLLLDNGHAPGGNLPQEIVLRSFQFVPLGNPAPALLTNVERAGSQTEFRLDCQPDWRYRIQSSVNLGDWQTITELLATNFFQDFVDPVSTSQSNRFYRALTLP